MPFKSKAQQRKMFAMKAEGKLKGVDLKEWADKTDFSKLPEHVKSANDQLAILFSKIAARLFKPNLTPPVPSRVLQTEVIEQAKEDKLGGKTPIEYRNDLTARNKGIAQRNRQSSSAV